METKKIISLIINIMLNFSIKIATKQLVFLNMKNNKMLFNIIITKIILIIKIIFHFKLARIKDRMFIKAKFITHKINKNKKLFRKRQWTLKT
jgi:hypothetical protein